MSQLLTISKITQEALPVFQNKLALTRAINKQYSSEFARSGAKIGNVVNVRVPPRYTVSSGPALDMQESIETFVPVTLTDQSHIDIPFSSVDLTLSVDDYRERFLEPAMTTLANYVDYQAALRLYKKVANFVGTIGGLAGYTTAQSAATLVLQAKQKLIELGVPDDDQLAFLVNPQAQTYLVSLFTNLFNPTGTISRQFTRGAMGDGVLGFNFAATANMPTHTYGTYKQGDGAIVDTDNTGQVGPGTDRTADYAVNIKLGGAGTTTLKAGTVVTFGTSGSADAVYEVNPQTRQSTGQLKQFVVIRDFTFAGATGTALYVWPAPVFQGAFQNASNGSNKIAASAAVTVPNSAASSATLQNLAFHPSAFTLASADLELINDGATSARANWQGISMRILKTYLPGTDQQVLRADVLWGVASPYPEMAVRITN